MEWSEYKDAISDEGILGRPTNKYPLLLPGQRHKIKDDFGGQKTKEGTGHFLDCDCNYYDDGPTPNIHIVNSWEKWQFPMALDQVDGYLSVSGDTGDPGADGYYDVRYSAIDLAGNQAHCDIDVILDTTPPTCRDFYEKVSPDGNNKNYSLPVRYDDPPQLVRYDISGKAREAYLSPPRYNPGIYFVGIQPNATYKSTWFLMDRAGNNGSCSWEVFVDNPNPCIGNCSDSPPLVQYCPDSINKKCNEVSSGFGWDFIGFGTMQGKFCNDLANVEWGYDNGLQRGEWNNFFETYVDDVSCATECDKIPGCNYFTQRNTASNYTSFCQFAKYCEIHQTPDTWEPFTYMMTDEGCGCGDWLEPQFVDDKGIVRTEVFVDGWKSENNGPRTNLVTLGTHTIEYRAYDMLNQWVSCEFNVTIQDTTRPYFEHCPSDAVFDLMFGGSVDYEYHVHAIDTCKLNEYITYNPIGFPYDNEWDDGTETLYVNNNYTFTYQAFDASDNARTCSWEVRVKDNGSPSIVCSPPIRIRVPQGYESVAVFFSANATDSADEDPVVTFTKNPGSQFTPGWHKVTATATDDGGNQDSCNIYITVLDPYPFCTFEPAVNGAIVSEDMMGNIGADVRFITHTNMFHRVQMLAGPNLPGSNHNDNMNTQPVEVTGSVCPLEKPICEQQWKFRTTFDECLVLGDRYELVGHIDCVPNDCPETCTEPFVITLSAANYCWQDLAGIHVDVQLITVPQETHDEFDVNYAENPKVLPPQPVTIFSNGDWISGIVYVLNSQVDTENVRLQEAYKEHFWDKTYLTFAQEYDLMGSPVILERMTWASFTYQELDIPLETVWYTKYHATVQLTYNFGYGRRRRQLLQVSGDDDLGNTNDLSAVAEAMTSSEKFNKDNMATPDDAVVVMRLNECSTSTLSWEGGVSFAVGKFLKIDPGRVLVLIDRNSDCLTEITIKAANCDAITMHELIGLLQDGTLNPFSELHGYLYREEAIPDVATIDTTMFFIQQTPTVYKEEISIQDLAKQYAKGFVWYINLIIGIVGGLILTAFITSLVDKDDPIIPPQLSPRNLAQRGRSMMANFSPKKIGQMLSPRSRKAGQSQVRIYRNYNQVRQI